MKIDVFLLTTVCPSPRGEDLLCLGSQFAFSLFCGGFLLAESNPQDYVVSVRVGSFPSIRCVLLYTKTFGSNCDESCYLWFGGSRSRHKKQSADKTSEDDKKQK